MFCTSFLVYARSVWMAETSVAERSRSTGYKLVSCGQKSTKICSNRSNRIFCLICCCLFDFSRSDFLKVSLSVRLLWFDRLTNQA